MERPEIIKQQMTVGEGQLKVEMYPDKKPPPSNGVDNSSYDILRLVLTSIEGNEMELYMTPDEALEISSILSASVQMWLLAGSDGYRKEILEKRWKGEEERTEAAKLFCNGEPCTCKPQHPLR